MRRLRIVCAVSVLTLVGFAVALKSPATASARAQDKSSVALSPSLTSSIKADSSASQASAAAMQSPVAQSPSTITIATNFPARSLAVDPQSPSSANAISSENSSAQESALLYLTNADKGNRIYTLPTTLNSSVVTNAPSGAFLSALSARTKIAVFAGQSAAGSLGDGGAASAAEFDLKLDSLAMRSGVVVAPDGTIFVADTLNGTVRSIAGAGGSEPGIVRSVVGRFGPRQNFDLAEPLGLALDRAGNLYIADRAANAVLMLHAAASDLPGALEILAHVVSPAAVGVTLDGSKVFAASPDTGVIVEINANTRSISTSAISPSQLFTENQKRSGNARIIPTGLAVDSAGNLFVSFSGPGGGLDQIWRLDATSGKVTSAARGLTSPGEIAFDSNGNLFVSDQGTHRLLELRGAGVPADGVTLAPPAGPVPTDFGVEPVEGTTSFQSFTLINNSGATITQITSAFQGTDPDDFTVMNTTCSGTLLTDSSCVFNVAFKPQDSGQRSASLAVTYTAANTPNTLTAALVGTGDDYQIVLASGAVQQITINAGSAATFLLQIVPDDTFRGPVTLNCPVKLPTATTCGISAGTTVTTPLVPSLTVDVSRGTAVPFNITFQTTAKNGTMTAMVASAPYIYTQSSGSNGPGASSRSFIRFPALIALAAFVILCAMFAPAIFRLDDKQPDAMCTSAANLFGVSPSGTALFRLISTFALFVVCVAALGGCGSSSSSGKPAFTPAGKTDLMVQGTAQNAVRGFTVTLVVN